MRILIVTNLFPPVVRGGYEVECAGVVDHLRASGHEVLVLTSALQRDGIAPEAGVRRLLPTLGYTRRDSLRGPPAAVVGARAVRRALADHRPELIYVWNGAELPGAALRVATTAGVPVAFRVCEHWFSRLYVTDTVTRRLMPAGSARRGAGAMRQLNRLGVLRLDLATAAPAALSWASDALRRLNPVPPPIQPVLERTILPVTPQSERFAGIPRRPAAQPTLAYVGRVEAQKGPEVAVRALAHLRDRHRVDARLVLAGHVDPEVGERLRLLAGELGVARAVELRGPLDVGALQGLLEQAHALVFPPLWQEPAGLVCLEAALARVPIVAARSGGVPEIVRDEGEALLFDVGDDEGCAEAIARTLARPAETAERVERAFARGRELSFASYLAATDAFLDDAVRMLRTGGGAAAPRPPHSGAGLSAAR